MHIQPLRLKVTSYTLFCVLMVCAQVLSAEEAPTVEKASTVEEASSDESKENNTAVFGPIYYRTFDVFDDTNPKESAWFYRTVNFLHIKTKPFVIRKQLLFKPGQAFSTRLMQESERILRANSYMYDAKIRVIKSTNNRMDVEVQTRDAWTLTGGVNYHRSGGENRSSFEIEEKNLFGLGKTLRVRRNKEQNRSGNLFEFQDPAFTSSLLDLSMNYTNNSDGEQHSLALQKPFIAMDSHNSFGGKLFAFTREERLYSNGQISSSFKQDEEELQIFAGLSKGIIKNKVRRWRYGYHFIKNRFSDISGEPAPADRTLSYPWIELSGLDNRFVKTRRIDHIARTEDINMGSNFSLKLGLARKHFGSDKNLLILQSAASTAFRIGFDNVLMMSVETEGRLSNKRSENLSLKSIARYFMPLHKDHALYANLELAGSHNADRDNQLLLGGNNGLRGYPSNYMSGNRKVLLNLEKRFYSDTHVLQLFHMAALIFFDAGYAWNTGSTDSSSIVKDVGMGLRLGSSRSGRGKILHLDLAFPLDGDVDRRQFLVSTHSRF